MSRCIRQEQQQLWPPRHAYCLQVPQCSCNRAGRPSHRHVAWPIPTSCHTIVFRGMIIIMLRSIERHLKGLRARQQRFENGRHLFHRGDPVTEMHFVTTGSIHLVRHQSDGSSLILQRASPGSILAEASLYSETYHCDAVASGAADTRAYAKASLKKLLA